MKKLMKVEYDDIILEDENDIEISPIINGKEYFPTSIMELKYDITRQMLNKYTRGLDNHKKKQYVFKDHGRNYYSPGVLFLKQKLKKKLTNHPYAEWLSQYTWDYAVTIGFPNSVVSPDVARKYLNGYWKELCAKLGVSRINLFIIAERYPDGHGYHLHGVVRIMDESLRTQTERVTRRFFNKYRADVSFQNFDEKNVWVSYIVKQIERNIDSWEMLQHRGKKVTAMGLI